MTALADQPILHPAWADIDHLHRDFLDRWHGPRSSHVMAFQGPDLVAVVVLRPFEQDGHHGKAIIEALTFLLPLGTDRVSVGMLARVPHPAITEDTAKRRRGRAGLQPAMVQTTADSHGDSPCTARVVVHPFDLDRRCQITWRPTVELPEPDSWLCAALPEALAARHDLPVPTPSHLECRRRELVECGHVVALAPLARGRLGRLG